VKYQPPFVLPSNPDPNAPYVNGDPSAGIKGSIIPAQAIEYTQREVVNTIQKGGYVPADPTEPVTPADPNFFQLTQGVRRALYAWGIDTGSTNALSVQLDPPLTAYAQGLEIRVMVAHDNTAACTIRVNGLSTQQIIKKDGSTLMAGDMRQGGIAVLVHDGANFQLVSGAAGSTTIPGGWFNGADFFVDTGTVEFGTVNRTHIVGTPPVAPTAYAAGQGFSVQCKNFNPAGATSVDVNVNSLGAKPLVMPTGAAMGIGDLNANTIIRIIYDGSKFVFVSRIDIEIIDTAVTKIVGPNAGADFADLIAAMEWVSRRRFAGAGSVTFSMQGKTGGALVHNYSSDVIIKHPQGMQISIVGAGMNSIPVPAEFDSNARTAGAVTSEAGAHTNTMRGKFQTELKFTGTAGIKIFDDVGLLKNLLITGKGIGGTPNQDGIYVDSNSYVGVLTVAVCLFPRYTWYLDTQSMVWGKNFYSIGSGNYVGISHGSTLIIDSGINWLGVPAGAANFIIGDSLVDGIQASFGANIQVGTTYPKIFGTVGNGVTNWGSSNVYLPGVDFINCAQYSLLTIQATAMVGGGSARYCNWGYAVSTGGSVDCSSCTTAGVTNADYQSAHGSYMYAAGNANSSAQFQPAPNSPDGSNAIIEA
jgi:hypothetical protein